jgi:DNA-binding transcriptional regulator YhcF (GntR family)
MDNLFESNTPIYLQLVRLFTVRIACGEWRPGDRLSSVRDLAVLYKVNPNTVQRALTDLEREGLVYAERTSGRFITSDEKVIRSARDALICREVDGFLLSMRELGLTTEDCEKLLSTRTKKDGSL